MAAGGSLIDENITIDGGLAGPAIASVSVRSRRILAAGMRYPGYDFG